MSTVFLLSAAGLALGLIPGRYAVVAAVTVTTAIYTALLVARALRLHHTAAPCQGVGLLGMGLLAGGAGMVGGALTTGRLAAYPVAIGTAASVVLFLIALLLLPGVAPTVRSKGRRLVDGLAIGICVFFAGWTLVVSPLSGDRGGPAGPHVITAVVLLAVLCTTLATIGLISLRAVRYRAYALACAAGVALLLIEQATVALLLLLEAGWYLILAAVAVWAVGPLLLWLGVRRAGTRPVRPEDAERRGP
ncbi:MAG: hypothetical protein ACRDT4_20100, partial [Micromonosporaceae bacterium]